MYGGPIGAVLTPLLVGLDNAVPLPHASSLCGACKQACPVDINIPDMLLMLRNDLKDEQEAIWKIALKSWNFGNTHPLLYELGGKAASIATVKDRKTRSSFINGTLRCPEFIRRNVRVQAGGAGEWSR